MGRAKKDPADMVAAKGFEAMMKGDADVVAGWHNKVLSTVGQVLPSSVTAELHRRMAEPKGAG